MAVTFSADEIFAMAEQIERNGAMFYRVAAKGLSDTKIKKLLEELADMEVDHEKTFTAMRSELTASEQPNVFDPNDEVGMYLRVLAEGKVFDLKSPPAAEQLTGRETPRDILRTAIDLEKDSIVLYLGLEEYVSPKAGKDRVKTIIKEEMGHIALLTDKLADYK